ncbi:hypothetical protein ACWGKX_35480, partial [Streptomyces tricolor]
AASPPDSLAPERELALRRARRRGPLRVHRAPAPPAAHELSQLLRGEVEERDARDVKSLSAHMHPLVVQALLTTFQRSLREELSEWLTGSGTG